MKAAPPPQKNPASQRIEVMDALRGFAICGLPLIHVLEFAFGDPPVFVPSEWHALDQIFFYAIAVLGAAKFISLFGVLFGAGIVLASRHSDQMGEAVGWRFVRRFLSLFLLGILHAYLVWHGDILAHYALLGLLLFSARGWRPRNLAIVGLVLLTVLPIAFLLIGGFLTALGVDLPAFMGEGAEEDEFLVWINESLDGGWLQQMPARAVLAIFSQLLGFPFYVFWFSGGLMLLGMAGAKSGYLLGERPAALYRRRAWLLLPLGLALGVSGKIVANLLIDRPGPFVLFLPLGYLAVLVTAASYIHAFLAWSKRDPHGVVWRSLGAVGRMALTNYLFQSVLLGLIFYGHGLGLRGALPLHLAILTCPAIWLFQILFSRCWSGLFRYGPLEWAWRCLTYWRWMPLRRRPAPPG